jgi:hypothetical protein
MGAFEAGQGRLAVQTRQPAEPARMVGLTRRELRRTGIVINKIILGIHSAILADLAAALIACLSLYCARIQIRPYLLEADHAS